MTQDIKPLIERLETKLLQTGKDKAALISEKASDYQIGWRAGLMAVLEEDTLPALKAAQAEIGRLQKQAIAWEAMADIHANGADSPHQVQQFIERLQAREVELVGRYNELLMEVESKYPGKTRHETARRFIRERQNHAEPEATTEKS